MFPQRNVDSRQGGGTDLHRTGIKQKSRCPTRVSDPNAPMMMLIPQEKVVEGTLVQTRQRAVQVSDEGEKNRGKFSPPSTCLDG